MFKMKKNDPAAQELEVYAKKKGKPVKEVLLSDEHLNDVCDIFYPHLPKMVKMVMKKDKFVDYYKTHRTALVAHMG